MPLEFSRCCVRDGPRCSTLSGWRSQGHLAPKHDTCLEFWDSAWPNSGFIKTTQGPPLSSHPWKDIVDNFFHHLIAWQHLASQCEQKGLLLFKLRPKHHGLDHMVSQLLRTKVNPRKSMSCFADESFLGHLKKIVTKCHSVSVLRRFYQRYLILLSFRWHESRSWISASLGVFRGQESGPPNCGHVDSKIHAAWQYGQKGASVWLLAETWVY